MKISGILILSFILFSKTVFGQELFGFKSFESLNKYLSLETIKLNKSSHPESNDNYFAIEITNFINKKYAYADTFYLDFYQDNIIHQIIGTKKYPSLKDCLGVQKKMRPIVKQKYDITNIRDYSSSLPDFQMETIYGYTKQNSIIKINCNRYYSGNKVEMWIILMSIDINDSINRFYKGL